MSKVIESGCGNVTTLAGDEVPNEINISDVAKTRIEEICNAATEGTFMRVAIEGGGCSGFQYMFGFDDELIKGDIVSEWDGGRVVVDEVSIEYIKGATVHFIKEFGSEYFTVENPLAKSKCGCGSSFTPKEGFEL